MGNNISNADDDSSSVKDTSTNDKDKQDFATILTEEVCKAPSDMILWFGNGLGLMDRSKKSASLETTPPVTPIRKNHYNNDIKSISTDDNTDDISVDDINIKVNDILNEYTNDVIIEAEEVLNFWFGDDIKVSYKTKWFPSASDSLQETMDKTIVERFELLFDKAIAQDPSLDTWKYNPKYFVALIVTVDQFSRHIYRYQKLPSDSVVRKRADNIALKLATELVEKSNNWDKELTIAQFVFALMPYRHTPSVSNLDKVMACIDNRRKREDEEIGLLEKFRKETLRRLQHLQDRAKADESDEILERPYLITNEDDMLENNLVIATLAFLKKYYTDPKTAIAISLSGGVDSMVIAKILVKLKEYKKINNNIIAIHIDYNNRKESTLEANYVQHWSELHGLVFHKRVVSEVTRGITDRTEYEKVSRDIRYNFYKKVLYETNCNAVIFGHHLGDVQENVISNVMRGCSPVALSGMGEVGITNGVAVWRPLLEYNKDDIYAFAHKYGVPYFKDTTPSWSTRGKLRRQLVPLLVEMYGEGVLKNLSSLAVDSDETKLLIQENVYDPFLKSVHNYQFGLKVNVIPFKDQSLIFWKEILKELMHSLSMSLIREKAVKTFMERVARFDVNKSISGWLELKKNFDTYLTDDGTLIVFRDGFLHSAPGTRGRLKKNSGEFKDEEGPDNEFIFWERGTKIKIPKNLSKITAELQPWRITISRISNEDNKAIVSNNLDKVESFLTGNFSYEVEVPIEGMDADDVTLVVLSDYKKIDGAIKSNGSKRSNVNITNSNSSDNRIEISPDFELVAVRDLGPVDQRLKIGLPLLVPFVATETYASKNFNYFRLDYHHINYTKTSPTKSSNDFDKKIIGTPAAFTSVVSSSLSSKSPSPTKASKPSSPVTTSPSALTSQLSAPHPSTPAVALTPASLNSIQNTGDRYHEPSSTKPALSVSTKSPRLYTPGSDDDTPPNSVFKQLQLEEPAKVRETGRRLELNEFSNPTATPDISPTSDTTSSSRSNSSDGSPRVDRRRSKQDDFGSRIVF